LFNPVKENSGSLERSLEDGECTRGQHLFALTCSASLTT